MNIFMNANNACSIVESAIERNELNRLLLGDPIYCYRDRYSPAPGKTDLMALLNILYERSDQVSRKQQLLSAIESIIDQYEGIMPVADCIFFEVFQRSKQRRTFELPVEDLASRLRISIKNFKERLIHDKSAGGSSWPDGMLGELRHLNKIMADLGGPRICD